jgi:hypothetical protein
MRVVGRYHVESEAQNESSVAALAGHAAMVTRDKDIVVAFLRWYQMTWSVLEEPTNESLDGTESSDSRTASG